MGKNDKLKSIKCNNTHVSHSTKQTAMNNNNNIHNNHNIRSRSKSISKKQIITLILCLKQKIPDDIIFHIITNFVCIYKLYNNPIKNIQFFMDACGYKLNISPFSIWIMRSINKYREMNKHINKYLVVHNRIEKIRGYNNVRVIQIKEFTNYKDREMCQFISNIFINVKNIADFKLKNSTSTDGPDLSLDVLESYGYANIYELVCYTKTLFYAVKPSCCVYALKS